MDLSGWLEPRAGFVPAPLTWLEMGPESDLARRVLALAPSAGASYLRLERCLGVEDAARMTALPDTLGVYCLTLGESQSVLGLEPWTPACAPPEGRGEMLVRVREVSPGAPAGDDGPQGAEAEKAVAAAGELPARENAQTPDEESEIFGETKNPDEARSEEGASGEADAPGANESLENAAEVFEKNATEPGLPRSIAGRTPAFSGAEPAPGLDFLRPKTTGFVFDMLRAWRAASDERRADGFLRLSFSALRGGRAGDVACTPGLLKMYQERWDENPAHLLPYLWLHGPGAERFRWRYRTLVSELFRIAFLAPLHAWCEDEHARLVLRMRPDETLLAQAVDGLGPVMRFFEWADVPASGRGNEPGNPAALEFRLRQGDSVAAQLRLPAEDLGRAPGHPAGPVCEAFPSCAVLADGRAAGLAEWRLEAERRLALGAGFLEIPRAAESLRGDGKRRGGSLLFHESQPWWEDFAALKQCLGRQAQLLAQGRRVTHVLVLTPSDSLMAMGAAPMPDNMQGLAARGAEFNRAARDLERSFQQLLRALEAHQIDYDLGDEDILERHGEARANAFAVGGREYTLVVIPPALSWRRETLRKVWRFARKGGSVVLARPFAAKMDMEDSAALERLAEEFPNVYTVERAGREVCFQANRLAPQPLQIKPVAEGQSAEGLLARHHHTLTHEIFHAVNTRRAEIDARVTVQAEGAARILDAWTPGILTRETEPDKKAQAFPFLFNAGASALFAIGGESDLTETPYQRMPHATLSEPLGGRWRFERLGPNLHPLRQCRWRLGEESPARPVPVEFARMEIQKRLTGKVSEAAGHGAAEFGPASDDAAGTQAPREVALLFEFESRMEAAEELGVHAGLAVETNEGQQVFFNGRSLACGPDAGTAFLDPAIRLLDVTALLKKGRNQVELRFPARADMAVEAPLLAGDFAVLPDQVGTFALEEEPATLCDGDLGAQGYPCFAGRMRLWQDFTLHREERKRYFIRLDQPAATAARAHIGEHQSAALHSAPHRMEITRLARDGENRLEVEIAASLYNALGPVHLSPKLIRPGMPPEAWDAQPWRDRRLWNPKPALHPFGLIQGARLETFDPDAVPPPPAPKRKAEDEPSLLAAAGATGTITAGALATGAGAVTGTEGAVAGVKNADEEAEESALGAQTAPDKDAAVEEAAEEGVETEEEFEDEDEEELEDEEEFEEDEDELDEDEEELEDDEDELDEDDEDEDGEESGKNDA